MDAVLRRDAEPPSHGLYLKTGALWSVATGLWFVWSLRMSDKEIGTKTRSSLTAPHCLSHQTVDVLWGFSLTCSHVG